MRARFRLLLTAALAASSLAQEPAGAGPRMSPEQKKIAAEWNRKMGRGEGKLQPGTPAPDFSLKMLRAEGRVTLSSFRGNKPVALVFASYT